MDEYTLTLNSPITEEQWDAITDVDFEHTNEITFHTKHGKEVKFVKASTQPERKRGKWKKEYWHSEYTRECSVCHVTQTVTTYRGKVNFKFCPYCGAKMEVEDERPD